MHCVTFSFFPTGVSVFEVLGASVLIDSIMLVVITSITLVVVCGLFTTNQGPVWVLVLLCLINGCGGMFQGKSLLKYKTNEV